jgi:hypothetical protein
LLWAVRRGRIGDRTARSALLGLTLVDLIGFGFGLNPAIDRADDRPETPVLGALRREVGRSGRIIGLGTELPPNTLMRYGLADARNYDSVELARNLDWFGPLYDPTVESKSSRREITWARVLAGRDRLREASVRAVVGPTPPPPSEFVRTEKVGSVWVAWLDAAPLVEVEGDGTLAKVSGDHGRLDAEIDVKHEVTFVFRETFDPGWRAEVDGRASPIEARLGTFQSIQVPAGIHRVAFTYDPFEVRMALIASAIAAFTAVFALTGFGPFRSTRIVLQRLGRTQAIGLESES